MSIARNELGQPVGPSIGAWTPPPTPPRTPMTGRFCRLEPLDPARHAAPLFAAYALDADGRNWTYLPYGPFDTLDAYRTWMDATCGRDDPLFHAIVDGASGDPVGVASYLRIFPAEGSIEVGHLSFSPRLQRTPAATEAMYLMMQRTAIDAEWPALQREFERWLDPANFDGAGRQRSRLAHSRG